MSDTTAVDYIVTDTTKALGESLELLAKLRDDIEGIKTENLASLDEAVLTKLHEGFKNMNVSLGQWRLLTLIAQVTTSKTPAEDNS